ncbi:MAG: hypothetical protein HQL39_13805 [Alphaproteobacteria bacterium]|nr:hypothetical protein [Alphaproteobacteria bacterium]
MNKDIAALRRLFERGFERTLAEQRRQAESIAEIRGELRGLSAWLSSMDQRFVAIMRPYEPPHRPAE